MIERHEPIDTLCLSNREVKRIEQGSGPHAPFRATPQRNLVIRSRYFDWMKALEKAVDHKPGSSWRQAQTGR